MNMPARRASTHETFVFEDSKVLVERSPLFREALQADSGFVSEVVSRLKRERYPAGAVLATIGVCVVWRKLKRDAISFLKN